MGDVAGCCVGGSVGMILGGLVNGGINAAFGALSGAVGASILDASGYPNYSVSEATQMGAAGSAIMGATVGACVGGVVGCLSGVGLFGNNNKGDDDKNKNSGLCSSTVNFVGTQVLGGMLGWAIMHNSETVMSLGTTAAALATGAAVTFIPATIMTYCCALPLVLAGIACMACNSDKDAVTENTRLAMNV
jgi:hypothetical protein